MIRKVLSFEVNEVRPRVLEFVGSTEDRDRMGDIIMASGWQLKDFKKNPVFLWAHQYDTPPVGKAVKVWIDNDRLKFHIQFAQKDEYEFADTIYKLYKGGYLRATSVGFMPIESEPIEVKDEDTMYHTPTRYLKQDLLELSACPVPANPNALAEAKTKGLITDNLIQEIAETEDLTEKPYPSEHSCRLRDPGDFQDDSFRRTKRNHEGKEYSVIMGKLRDEDTMTEQAYRYNKDVWTAQEAGNHCKEHEGTFEAANEENQTESVSSTIRLDSLGNTTTMRSGNPSQAEIGDEIDYLLSTIKTEGLNEANLKTSWALVDQIIRLSGSDIPVEIAEKIGKKPEVTGEEVLAIVQVSVETAINQALEKIWR